MKCCHIIDESLPLYLDDSGESDALSPIGATGSGGLGLALLGLGGGGLGSPGVPNPGAASISI